MEYTVFHADDLQPTGITRDQIARTFELLNCKVTWSLEPHEQQNPEQQAGLAKLQLKTRCQVPRCPIRLAGCRQRVRGWAGDWELG